MYYVRKITNSDLLASVIDIPKELRNRKVEIIILPYENSVVPGKKTVKGAFSKYKNEKLKDKENTACSVGISSPGGLPIPP